MTFLFGGVPSAVQTGLLRRNPFRTKELRGTSTGCSEVQGTTAVEVEGKQSTVDLEVESEAGEHFFLRCERGVILGENNGTSINHLGGITKLK